MGIGDGPGVFDEIAGDQLKDKRGRIIYIGKALNLKNRVSTYFQHGARHLAPICGHGQAQKSAARQRIPVRAAFA